MAFLPKTVPTAQLSADANTTTVSSESVNTQKTGFLPKVTAPITSKTSTQSVQATQATQYPFASVDTLGNTAIFTEAKQITESADGAPILLVLGADRIGAKIINAVVFNGDLVIAGLLGEGEIEAAYDFTIDDQPIPAGVSVTVYTGTATQGVDPTLAAAYAAQLPAISYTDTRQGTAYFVMFVPQSSSVTGFPRVNCLVKGIKPYDPRDNTQVFGNFATYKWSNNPALLLAHVLHEQCDFWVDYQASIPAFDRCDQLLGVSPNQQKRRMIDMAIPEITNTEQIIDTLRSYAGCWIVPDGRRVRLVPDGPAAVSRTWNTTVSPSEVFRLDYVRKTGRAGVPDAVDVAFTDRTKKPWRTDTVRVSAVSGTPLTIAKVDMPGITRRTEARRVAIERLNHARLLNLEAGITVRDPALDTIVGDVHALTDHLGFALKQFRVSRMQDLGFGRYSLGLTEYDTAVYSDVVIDAPTVTDTGSPNCATVPTPTITFFNQVNGWEGAPLACVSRMRAVMDCPYFPCLKHYEWELISVITTFIPPGPATISTNVIASGVTGGCEYLSAPCAFGTKYRFRVRIISTNPSQAPGPWATSADIVSAAFACPPKAPEYVRCYGRGTFVNALGTNGVYTQQKLERVVLIAAPQTPITDTEVWFAWGTQGFAQAKLMLTTAGSLSSFSMYVGYNGASDAGGLIRDAATIVVGSTPFVPDNFSGGSYSSPGSVPSGAYPGAWPQYGGLFGLWQLPTKVFVRFKNGTFFSETVELTLSLPDTFLAVNNSPFGYQPRNYYTLDVSDFVANGALDVVVIGTSYNAPYDTAAQIAGVTSYQYVGSNNHELTQEFLDQNGDPNAGFVRSARYLIEPQLGV